MFVCTTGEVSPLAANSPAQKDRDTKPRSSRCGSRSTIVTPSTSVGVYFTAALLPSSRYRAALVDRIAGVGGRCGLLDGEGFGVASAALHPAHSHQAEEHLVV